jgi:hypothetical protein
MFGWPGGILVPVIVFGRCAHECLLMLLCSRRFSRMNPRKTTMNFEFWEAAGLVRCPKNTANPTNRPSIRVQIGVFGPRRNYFFTTLRPVLLMLPRARARRNRGKSKGRRIPPAQFLPGCPNPAAWLRGTPAYPKAALATPKLFCGR